MTKRRQTSDGRVMTQPELQVVEGSLSPDTVFTVTGPGLWGNTSEYDVVLNGPNSYYTYYKQIPEEMEDGQIGFGSKKQKGNDPARIARYRSYVKEGEKAQDYTSLWDDFLKWVGLKRQQGGWLNKFQNGGVTSTQQPSQEQVMKELLNIVQQAATELQSNKPGQGVQTLAQIANDPQGSQLLDALVQQVPEAGQIVEAVMKMVGAYKCGGKTKKKVKKGAKGCVPCKKLMRVGGKLVNVWSDCEGNIISKHQIGGYLIPKGQVGLTAQFVQEPYRKAKASTDAGNANDVHYYLGDDNKIYTQTYTTGTGWGAGKLADMNNFKNWATTANTSGQILGKNFFVNGFNFDYNTNMGIMSEADAQAAGIDGSKYATAGKVVDGVVGAGGNDLYGIEAKDPTKRDALNQRGLSPILNATFIQQNAANALAKENFRTQRRAVLKDKNLWGKGYLKNARNTKNTIIAQNNAEASKDRAAWMTEFGHMNTPSNTTPVEIPKYQPAEGTTPAAGTTTGYQSTSAKYKKQGGWLTKFN